MEARLPIVGVMGSGSEPHSTLAKEVASVIASLPAHLLTGGGGGVMHSVAEHFVNDPKRGSTLSIGVIPCDPNDPTKPKPGYPNPHVEIPIFTHLALSGSRGTEQGSRNHINVLTPTAIVALPGGDGTVSEIALALRYRKPVVAYARDPKSISHFPDQMTSIDNPADLKTFLESICHPVSP